MVFNTSTGGGSDECPETLTISSKDSKTAFTEGDKIELTAALSAGNGDISYQWYKGSVAPANAITGATNAKYEVASCTTANAGDYFCVASKDDCPDAVNASAFAITVEAAPVIEPTGDATITYALSGSTATGTVSGVNSISSLSTALAASTLTIGDAKSGYSGAISGCSSTTELQENDYVDVQFTVASGYVFTPSAVSVKVNPFNATSAVRAVVALQDAALDVRSEVLACDKSTDNAVVFADGAFTGKEFEGTVHVRIYFYGPASSKAFYIKSPIEITGAVAVAPTKYDLEFAANGGEGTMSTLKYKSGVEVTLPACTFDAPSASQEFDAWVVTKKVGGASVTVTDGKFTMPAEAVVATATWKTKDVKYTVTYKEGEATIGTEEVIVGGHPAEYAAKQSKNLATFVDWYSDADLADGHLISDIAAMTVSEDVTVYGKWTYTYAQSVNVEKWVLDNGKTPNSDQTGALISLLGTRGFASNLAYVESNLELDSLNDGKGTGRNYAYLGLKVKVAGKMLDFRLAKDNTVKVKFGNVGATPLLAINGGEYAAMTIEDGVFAYTATGEDYISIKTADAKAVVFQQIMIGEDIQDVTLPEPTRHAVVLNKVGETEHGTLAVASPETYDWLAKDVEVTLTVAADEGYYIESVTLNGEALTPSEDVYSFAMPNATANVVATFAEIVPNNVTYKANNGGADADILAENATEIAGCSFTYAGHKFNGWNTAPDGTGNAYAEGDPVLSPLTLFAQWKEYFVITYKDGDDVLGTEDVFVGEAPVGIADPVKAMNIFKGWTLGGSDEVTDVTALDATTTVYAKWEAIDACFYFSAKSVDASTSIAVDEEIDNANGGKVIAKTNNISYETLGVLVASSGSTYMKVELDYAMIEGTKISVKLAAGGTSTRGVNICYDADKNHKAVPMTWSATEAGEVKEFEYTLDSESALNGKKEFFIYRAANTYIQTVMVKDCAPQDYTVTYKDGETVLGTEQVFENEHPTADGINTHKKGYEFQGWAEAADGDVVDLDDITITAAKNLFAQYTVKDCSPMGVKFSMVPQPNELTSDYQLTGTTEQLIGEYAVVTGGVVYLNNNNSSNRVKITMTTSTIQLVSGDEGYIHVELDCPLKENDSIKFDNSERLVLAHNASKTSSVNIAKTDHFYIVPASWEGKYDFYIWRTGTGCTISGIEVVRPEIYTVSFNMMGHGSTIAPKDVVKGAKIVAPTAPTDEDYAFAGWYKENALSNAWDFDNDVVVANTILYAKWIDMSDATLKSLKYGATDIALQDGVYEYNVELPALTTAVPALTAETTNPNANADVTNAASFDESGNAQSTVLVTPEKVGAATQTYIVNFAKAPAVEQVHVTGTTEWNFSNAGSTTLENQTDVVLANVPGITNDATFNSQALKGTFNKMPGNYFQGSVLQFHATVPGMLIVEYGGTNNKSRKLQVIKKVGTDEVVEVEWAYNSGDHLKDTVAVPAGDVILRAFEGTSANNARIYYVKFDADFSSYELTDNALNGYTRPVTEGRYGTICLENGGVMTGATLYEVAYYGETSKKIFFDEVLNGTMEAGVPYIYLPNEGEDALNVFYTDNADVTPATAGVNGLIGYIGDSEDPTDALAVPVGAYILNNNQYREVVYANSAYILSHRAYINLSAINPKAPALVPGRRRISMGVQSEQVVTGIDALNVGEQPIKVMINGQIFILRGEKMYDATGRLVK
ncbi:MAG: InlB B-repeat-containing protein [Prevotella sp.]|nr:InlB B-repeat-containing protein [Prevotella sp.]